MQKHRPTVLRAIALFLALVLVAASCGDDDVEPVATDAAAESEPAEAPADEAEAEGNDDIDENDDDAAAETEASGDASDLSSKPPVDATLLGAYDELMTTDIVVGDGDEAIEGATVTMQYVGVLGEDGTEFDTSWREGASPFTFTLGQGQVIAGWDEGIIGMRVGGRRVLQIPSAMAYRDLARGDVIGPNADLLFIVDLLAIEPPPPSVPEDALGPFDELGVIDLVEGTGDAVEPGDIIEVQYVGVTGDDGTEFDSSFARGSQPFRLVAGKGAVIEGWNKGILGMKVGGERIIQIPSAMAYDEGDLVFRVHLETLIEAPFAHTLTFDGPAPTEVEVSTLVEGTGEGARPDDTVEANITILVYSTSEIVQSTFVDEGTTTVIVRTETLLPGLNDAILGIKVGETRQIVLPAMIAFPEGVPDQAGLGEDDAIVFVIEPLAIAPLEG